MKREQQQIITEKPKPYFAYGSEELITEAEIEKRKIRMERAEKLGESFTRVTEDECENPYKVQALVLIAEDKTIPEDLLKKIEEFERNRQNEMQKK